MPVVTDAVIARTAQEIRDLAQRTQLLFAYRVGELVIEGFYGGDLSEWRSRGAKATSIRKLAEHLERFEVMSASTLYRYVAVHELLSQIGGVSALKHLTVTHAYAVLPLREPEQQRLLLAKAEQDGWSTRELERHVAQAKGGAAPDRRTKAAARRRRQSLAALTDRVERDAEELRRRLRDGPPRRRDLRRHVFSGLVRAREALEDAQTLANPKRNA